MPLRESNFRRFRLLKRVKVTKRHRHLPLSPTRKIDGCACGLARRICVPRVRRLSRHSAQLTEVRDGVPEPTPTTGNAVNNAAFRVGTTGEPIRLCLDEPEGMFFQTSPLGMIFVARSRRYDRPPFRLANFPSRAGSPLAPQRSLPARVPRGRRNRKRHPRPEQCAPRSSRTPPSHA